jgi:hypothetical protein
MRVWNAAFCAFALSMMCGCATEAVQTPGISKVESRTIPATVATHRIMSQLADTMTFVHPPLDPHHWPTRRLVDAAFYTHPHPSSSDGLCTTDEVDVYFQAPLGRSADPDTRVRARDISVLHLFHFMTLPAAVESNAASDDAWQVTRACGSLDPNTDGVFFIADNDESAWNAALLLSLVSERAKHEPSALPLDCGDPHFDCLPVVKAASLAAVSDVVNCDPPEHDGACYELIVDHHYAITIEANEWASNTEPLHCQIDKVWVRELIFTGDSRAD